MTNGENRLPEPKGPLQKELREAATPEKVWEAIKKAVEAISCLEITTEVTGVTEGGKLYTKIDLLQSDRSNQIDIKFLKDPDLTELRGFHAEQVKLAEQDIQKKLEFLKDLATALTDIIKKAKLTGEGGK